MRCWYGSDTRSSQERRPREERGEPPASLGQNSRASSTEPARRARRPEGVAVAVDPKAVLRILHSDSGANTLITLKLDGGQSRVMVKEYQLDPVTHQLLHADFYQLAMDKAITVTVPVLIKGEPKGVKLQGGLLDFVTRDIQVQCLPTDIPEHIDVDVSELMLHRVDPRARPGGRSEVEAGDRWRRDARARRDAEGRGSRRRRRRPRPRLLRAAEPEVIKKGKTEEKEEEKKK